MNHLLLAITLTIAAGFNRPTWIDVDPATGDIWFVNRGDSALVRIHDGVVTSINGLKTHYITNPMVTFNFGGPFGGGIAIEPANAGCGGGEYAQGFYFSNTGANQVVLGAFNYGSPVIANRDMIAILNGPFTSPTGIALSWGYHGDYDAPEDHDAVYIADTATGAVRRIRFVLSFEACPMPIVDDIFASGFIAPRGLAAAPDGSVYVADSGDHTIRRILPNGTVNLAVGVSGVAGSDEHHLNTPSGLAMSDKGELYIADTGNATIRKLAADGSLITIAGTPGVAGLADGPDALFNGPVGIRVVGDSIYVADTSNNAIRRIFLTAPPQRRRAF